ncbi:hypothetical protein PR048_019902 [Dryococelus australis]|uniref:Uncharacterized protein n=1 Tax=Dryococelus australis TaxID=614101 RepID=A0ABQ9H4V3_9NEOP|nr:hypothetical protein PR048_019902 [Dryococelus australis]
MNLFSQLYQETKNLQEDQQSNYAVPDYQFASSEELYRKVYFEALESITGQIQRRFEQTGYKKYAYIEEALATQPLEWNSKLSPHCTKTMEYVQCLRDMRPETRYLFSGAGKNLFVIFWSHLSHPQQPNVLSPCFEC